MLFTFLLVVHAIISALLVVVILMQRSEGGGLGMGGSPSGLMSARGAADFLTRATTILATAFILMSIGLAALATFQRGPRTIDTSLARDTAPDAALPAAPAPTVPLAADPLAAAGAAAAANGPSSGTGAIVPATPGTAGPATAPSRTVPASETAPKPVRDAAKADRPREQTRVIEKPAAAAPPAAVPTVPGATPTSPAQNSTGN